VFAPEKRGKEFEPGNASTTGGGGEERKRGSSNSLGGEGSGKSSTSPKGFLPILKPRRGGKMV